MSYNWDVFLSYNRKFPHGQWVDDIFLPLFEPYLDDALNRKVKIFKDTKDISAGSAWPERLKNSVAHSRCMVSIFSPSYFRSEWCMKEFAIMHHRQKQLGYLTVEKPDGLIVPVNLFDGEHFPSYARQLEMFDCKAFNRVGEGIKLTQIYIDFQGVLQGWVYDVAKVIGNAPAWNPAWLGEEWLDSAQGTFQPETETIVRRPSL